MRQRRRQPRRRNHRQTAVGIRLRRTAHGARNDVPHPVVAVCLAVLPVSDSIRPGPGQPIPRVVAKGLHLAPVDGVGDGGDVPHPVIPVAQVQKVARDLKLHQSRVLWVVGISGGPAVPPGLLQWPAQRVVDRAGNGSRFSRRRERRAQRAAKRLSAESGG